MKLLRHWISVLAVVLSSLAVVAAAPSADAAEANGLQPGDLLVADAGNIRLVAVPADGSEPWVFASGYLGIRDVAVARDGRVYLTADGSLYVFNSFGAVIGDRSVAQPEGIDTQPDGDLLVVDPGRSEVNRYSPNDRDVLLATDGNERGIDAVANGDFYVAHEGIGVRHYDRDGTLLDEDTRVTAPDWVAVEDDGTTWVTDTEGDTLYRDGATVAVDGGLGEPEDVAALPGGGVVVADGSGDRVVRTTTGDTWTDVDLGALSVGHPVGVAVVPARAVAPEAGDVYVTDPDNNRVLHYPADGGMPSTVGTDLRWPQGVAVDDEGNVYIADQPDHVIDVNDPPEGRLVKVSADGLTQTTLVEDLYAPWGVTADDDFVYVSDFSFSGGVYRVDHDGSAPAETVDTGAFIPAGLALDPAGNLWVADPYSSSVQKVPADGGPTSTLDAGVSFGWDVATNAAGDVIVAGGFAGTSVLVPGGTGTPEPFGPQHESPYGGAVSPDGDVLVADPGAAQVTRFSLDSGLEGDPVGERDFDNPDPDYVGPYDVAVFAPTPDLTSSTPPGATVDAPYSFTFTADGPGTFALDSGDLPAGLTLAPSGVLSGTPTEAGDFSIRVRVGNRATATLGPAQVLSVAKAAQEIDFVSTPPAALVGGTYQVSATGGTSGQPVVFSVAPSSASVCSVGGDTVTFLAVGTCVVRADQAGGPDHLAAAQASQTIDVGALGQVVAFTSTPPTDAVVGQTYVPAVSGSPDGRPVELTAEGGCELTSDLVTFLHAGVCTLTARMAGDAGWSEATAVQTVAVSPASTELALDVSADTLTADLDVVAPGAGAPAGVVTFTVDGDPVGTAELVASGDGFRAELAYVVPPGDHVVGAGYAGSADHLGSADTVERSDPALTATLSSRLDPRRGWYRTPVTVTFTCADTTAPLTSPCPPPRRVRAEGRTKIAAAVSAADGGRATVAVSVRVDRTGPAVKVRGVRPGTTYDAKRELRCVARDRLSGVQRCKVRQQVRGDVVRFKATAFDRAGNKTVLRGRYFLR